MVEFRGGSGSDLHTEPSYLFDVTEITPRKENVILKTKITLMEANDRDMLKMLEKRLKDLNEARMKLFQLSLNKWTSK